MSALNLTELNDCDNVTGFTDSNKTPGLNTLAGQRYEGSGAISVQHTNTAGGNEMDTTQLSGGGGTFNIDMSDRTYYFMLKDNLVDIFANQGVMALLGDGTDKVGFTIGGNNAVGMPVSPFYNIFKLDCSNLPSGNNTTFTGVEGNLTLSAITAMGLGTVHLAKAQGNIDNLFFDRMSHIANGSYALTINGGTAGTPEEMADVVADDISNGWGAIANPLGLQYIFFMPTEWGNVATIAEHAFTADGEQWYWLGDNAGGQAVGATHFPFRLVSNSTDTGSWIVSNTVIVNTGTRAQFLMDDADFDTIEMVGCALTGVGTISLPSAGGSSRFTTNNTFNNCDQITNNGADMDGCSILLSNVAANDSALLYEETVTPDGILDNMTFTKGANDHHAIEFADTIPASITVRGMDFKGFNASQDVDASIFHFKDTTGTITLNLIGCTSDVSFANSYRTDGATIIIVTDPVTVAVTVLDDATGNPIANVAHVMVMDADAGPPFTEIDSGAVNGSGVFSFSYSGATPKNIEGWAREMDESGTDYEPENFSGKIEAGSGFSITLRLTPLT